MGRSEAVAGVHIVTAAAATTAKRWTSRPQFPYDRRAEQVRAHSSITNLMNDTSRAARSAIALSGINLSLGRGAARVHILKDVDLHIGTGEAIGLVGPSGSGKTT